MPEPGCDVPDVVRRVERLSSPEFGERTAETVFVLPIGAVDPHGPHLPLGTDTVVATAVAERFATQTRDVALLPAIPYGCRTNPARIGGTFSGSLWLRATTFMSLLRDVLGSTYDSGGRRFLLVQAHYSNLPFVSEAVADFVASSPGARVVSASWWELVSEATRDAIVEETGVARGDDNHAALVETSLMLHLAPDLVRTDRFVDDDSERRVRYAILPMPESLGTTHGVVFRSRGADGAIGSHVIKEAVENLVAAVETELEVRLEAAEPPEESGGIGGEGPHAEPGVVWFTGIPGAGTSTLAERVANDLRAAGNPVCVLDEDRLQQGLNHDLGDAPDDHAESIRRIIEVARLMVESGPVVLVTATALSHDAHHTARARLRPFPLRTLFVDAPPLVATRDRAGVHTGIRPDESDLRVDMTGKTPEESAAEVLAMLTEEWIRR